jgi:ADP-ribose pyrophosphatase YjhB (NUDIX family)
MPKAVSKKQHRMMMAILHGDGPKNGRQPPKRIAAKYKDVEDDAPDSKHNDRGGDWNAHEGGSGEEKEKKKVTKERQKKKKEKKEKKEKGKDKKKLKKSFEQYYRGQGAGTVVINDKGHILVGRDCCTGEYALPGGHVDPGEDYEQAARRELREEAGIVADELQEIGSFKAMGNDSKVFFVDSYRGKIEDTEELKNVEFIQPHILVDKQNIRTSSKLALEQYFNSHLKKNSLQNLLAAEKLEKNVIRGGARSDVVFDVSHGDALKLVGNGCFRFLKRAVADMGDEDFRDIKLDNNTISIRKHVNDVYSGRISDGHKVIHQFTNKSLPQLCADIMSVFEWYHGDDQELFEILDEENLSDDAIHGGLTSLTENYTRHNLANIYTEMNNIREEIRHGNAVDLQQIEEKMMKLFDKLEQTTHKVVEQHNKLAQDAGKDIEELEAKLRELATKIDDLGKKPETVEARQTKPVSADKVYDSHYMYLPKPEIEIEPNGKIKICFNKEWTDLEKSNFLKDMKANIIRRK